YRAQVCGELPQAVSACLSPVEDPAGECERAQRPRFGPRMSGGAGGGSQEPEIESGVVRHEHRSTRELEERGHHLTQGGRPDEILRGDPREPADLWRE